MGTRHPRHAWCTVAQLAALPEQQRAADLRERLQELLQRWRGWRSDPVGRVTYPGAAHADHDWQAELDRRIASARKDLATLPPDADPAVMTDIARPLLAPEFWPHRPGPMADVAGQVAMLRAVATAHPATAADSAAADDADVPTGSRPGRGSQHDLVEC